MKKTFEIPVYNKEVRAKLKAGRTHERFESSWADVHLIEIRAHTETEAISSCRRKHPERLGFVMGEVMEVA